MIAPLFRIEAMRGCSCTGGNFYYPEGPVKAYVDNLRNLCNELLGENAKLKNELDNKTKELNNLLEGQQNERVKHSKLYPQNSV